MTLATYTITLGSLTLTEAAGKCIGFTINESGGKYAQSATITISNDDEDTWTDDIPARTAVTIVVAGSTLFDGFVDDLSVDSDTPGKLTVACVGHSVELRDSPVRPLVYDSGESSTQRDGAGVTALVTGGTITLPQDAKHVPIHELYNVTIGGLAVTVLNVDTAAGTIWVDAKHNGATATVNYTCFKAIYEEEEAGDILQDLFDRHAIDHLEPAVIAATATLLTFEPSIGSSLLDEWGRIKNALGNIHDFYVGTDHVTNWVARSGASTATVDRVASGGYRHGSFSADYKAYANVVTVTGGEGKTNSISQTRGIFTNIVEGLTPTGNQVDGSAQGFVALDKELLGFQVLATRQTENAALDWEIQYNGRRTAIQEPFTASHSLTPDTVNVLLDAATDEIHVKSAGVGTAYFSSDWQEDLNQDAGANDATTAGAWQSITVANLTRTNVKGIAFKTSSGSGQVKFEVRSGTTGSGTLLGTSETLDLATADRTHETSWYSVYFATAVDVSAETNITINKVNVSGTPIWTKALGTDPYAGGRASTDAADDFTFQLFTAVTLQDCLIGLARITDTVTDTSKTPLYYVARDYTIGAPSVANWVQVLTNTPRIMEGTTTTKFGIKIAFNSASITTDPLVSKVLGSVSYADPEDALDEPSGIVRGRLSGTAQSEVLPFFNPTLGTFTAKIPPSVDTRLEKNGRYWLVLEDGAAANSLAWFKLFYDDGSDGALVEPWDDGSNVDVNSNATISNGEAALTRNQTVGRIETTNLVTTAGTITGATCIQAKTERQGSVFPLLARNKRNYYHPFKSTTTTDAVMSTGELAILQFDTGDVVENGSGGVAVFDASGNGYNATTADIANWSSTSGKFGGGWAAGSAASEGVFVLNAGAYLMGDMSVSFWVKPTAAVADDKVLFAIDDGTRRNIRLVTRATGALRYSHTYNSGASAETVTSTATPLANGTWTHVAITRDFSTKELVIYLDGVADTTTTLSNDPDVPPGMAGTNSGCPTFAPPTSGGLHAGATATYDECRLWARVAEDWVIALVKEYPYTTGVGKFTFPVEADATDDYTDSDAADATKDDLRLIEFYWPAPFYEDGVLLRCPFDYGQFPSTSPSVSDEWDLSSYAQAINASFGATAPTLTATGAQHVAQADFNGTTQYLPYANSDSLHFDGAWSILCYLTHDVTAVTDTVFHKRGELKVEVQATSASASTITVTIDMPNGGTRTKAFTGLGIGTTQRHLGIVYDKETLSIYVDASLADSNDFGDAEAGAASTNAFIVGGENTTGVTVTNLFDGKLEELTIVDYAISAADLSTIRRDKSIGLRPPTEQSVTVAAYAGVPTKAYANGKYLVTRDDTDTWVDTLDGSTSNPDGSLAFKMEFGKSSLHCVRRDQTEIDRLGGLEVHKTFAVSATDIETLCSQADGYLDLLSAGLERGSIRLDGTAAYSLGQRITVNHPEKGQSDKDYSIAGIKHMIGDGDWWTELQVGEAPRTVGTVLTGKEVGISL